MYPQAVQRRTGKHPVVILIATAMIAACACASDPSEPGAGRGVYSMIELEVTPEQPAFIVGEEVAIRVRIANNGKAPFELPDPELAAAPQPVLSLQPPGAAQLSTFPVGPDAAPDAQSAHAKMAMIIIAPGEAWETVIPLNTLTDCSQPGEYRLTSSLDWQKTKAASEPQTFAIKPLTIAAVHLGFGSLPVDGGEGEIALIQRTSETGALYAARYSEMRPSIGEASVAPPIRRASVGPDASAIAVPWRNTPFYDERLQWLVWQESGELKALSTVSEEPVAFHLPDNTYRIVTPPLKVYEEALDIIVTTGVGRKLGLVRFDTETPEPKGALVWESDLPAEPAALTAALGPAASGSRRHVVFVATDDSGFDIYHTQFKADSKPGPFAAIRIDGLRPLSLCPPAAVVEADGSTIAGILAVSGDSVLAGTYVEVRFAADGTPATQSGLVPLGYFEASPQGAAVLIVEQEGHTIRRDLVIDFGESGFFKMGPEGGLVPVAVSGVPTRPLLLAPGKHTSYIVLQDPGRGLVLEQI